MSIIAAGVAALGLLTMSDAVFPRQWTLFSHLALGHQVAQASPGDNLLPNGGFENGSSWIPYHSIASLTSQAHSGASALQVSPLHAGSGLYYIVDYANANPANWVPNGIVAPQAGTYVATAWVRGVPGRQIELYLRDGTATTNPGNAFQVVSATGNWQSVSVSLNVSSAGLNLDIWVGGAYYQQGDSFTLDDVSLVLASPAPATATPQPLSGSLTPTPTATATRTAVPAATPTATPTATRTAVPTVTPSATTPHTTGPTATATTSRTATPLPSPMATSVLPALTATTTSVPTATATCTPVPPTDTGTVTATTPATAGTRGGEAPPTPRDATPTNTSTVAGDLPDALAALPSSGTPTATLSGADAPTGTEMPARGPGTVAAISTPQPSHVAVTRTPTVQMMGRHARRVSGRGSVRLTIAITPRVLRPGDLFVMRVNYQKNTPVRAMLSCGAGLHVVLRGHTDANGVLIAPMRVPRVRLTDGHGTAILQVVAGPVSGVAHAAVTTRLSLASMVLSVESSRTRACEGAVAVHVAYVADARVQLRILYANRQRNHVTVTADRHGIAVGHFLIAYPSRGQELPFVIIAHGQLGRLQHTEQLRVVWKVPAPCGRHPAVHQS